MDTIIYLSYVKKNKTGLPGECRYVLQEHRIQDYRLIKVRVEEWFAEADRIPSGTKSVSGKIRNKFSWWSKPFAGGRSFDVFAVGKRLRCRRLRRLQEQVRHKMSEQLRQELAACLNERDEVFLCFDETAGKELWVRSILPFDEFDAYLRRDWVYRLLEEACYPHFVVLGDVPYSKELLWRLAPCMKSILWIAPDRSAEEELEDFAEDFYQETGLAIRLQFLPADSTYGQLVIPEYQMKEAVNIVDLTEEKYIPRLETPKGSIWFNCASNLDKERRIEARRLSCRVISLRKQWKNTPFA